MGKDYFGEIEEDDGDQWVAPRMRNYEGEVFGQWTIVKRITAQIYLCRCSCGIEEERCILDIPLRSTQCIRCFKKLRKSKRFGAGS